MNTTPKHTDLSDFEPSENLLRAIALLLYNSEDYFILNGKAYQGNYAELAKDYEADTDTGATLEEWLEGYCDEIDEVDADDEVGGYIALTDAEADEKAAENIKESLWAFNASFILSECGLDQSGEKSLRAMQEKSCESANDFILSLVEKCTSLEDFTSSAISADGRAHFLNTYDGNENEQRTDVFGKNDTADKLFYIYRIN